MRRAERAEIMAPAGAMEQVYAAVRCGADAVYLGAGGFNARRNATNFDDSTLPEAVRYCHGRGVKVYVTVNTLIMDSELSALADTLDQVAAAGPDAVIIQDLAVLDYCKRHYPALTRFSSTQTVVHNVSGALELERLGFQSIMLARELTLREMEAICSAISQETAAEAFVHGAHCMSVSGACYLSGMIGGRSGNRGLCAQPCRLDWQIGKSHNALSLKDMSLISHIPELEEVGVTSLKIEGRMKRPEYVAAAVTACRLARAGQPYDEQQLRNIFSRSGFTDGYLTGKRDRDMFGFRTKEDVTGAEKVYKELQNLYKAETGRVSVDFAFRADASGSALTVSDGANRIRVQGEQPQQAVNRPMDACSAAKNLTKSGGTPFLPGSFTAEIAPGLMLPASALNALRREALDALLDARSRGIEYPYTESEAEAVPKHLAPPEPVYRARFYKKEQIAFAERFEKLLLPAHAIDRETIESYGDRLLCETPAVLFPEDEPSFVQKLTQLRDMGLRGIVADNIYALRLGRELGLTVHGGCGLNILNSTALREYEKQGLASAALSYELAMPKAKAMGCAIPRGIFAYGYLPLMRWRACPLRAHMGCAKCGERGSITDRLGVRFGVECTEKHYSTLLNNLPLHIAERDLRGFDYLLFYFTRESRDEIGSILEDYDTHRKSADKRTGGLYFRELQ